MMLHGLGHNISQNLASGAGTSGAPGGAGERGEPPLSPSVIVATKRADAEHAPSGFADTDRSAQTLIGVRMNVSSHDALYREFVRHRAQNGEAPPPPRERFLESLYQRRKTILADTGSDDVRFEVYTKEGRATLKATPIRQGR